MKARGPVYCSEKLIGTPLQQVWLQSKGGKRSDNNGPSGYKLRKSRILGRSLAALAPKRSKTQTAMKNAGMKEKAKDTGR